MGLNIFATIGLDGSGFESGLKRIEHAAVHAGSELKNLALASFGIYSVERAIGRSVEAAEKLIDTSRRLGVSIEALQELGFAARMNGADIEQLTNFIEKLNASRIDPKKWPSFAKLGIQNPLEGGVGELLMRLHANVVSRSSQEIVGPIRDIGGRAAGVMIPMLKDNMEELAAEAHRLGLVMNKETAVQLKFVADEMKIVSQAIVVGLAPALVFLMGAVMRTLNGFKADLLFWTTFAGGIKGKDWVTAFLRPFIDENAKGTRPEVKESIKRIDEAFQKAGAASENTLNDLNDAYDKQQADLIRKQNEIEKINAIPDFEPVSKGAKHGSHPYTDSLLRVGNFLGSTASPLERIAHEHTHLLKRIADNTAAHFTRQTFHNHQAKVPHL